MYLKSLKLAGFKSFADRARLEFRPGVTVVVGPNGSGKSNLVDALSWVLGTQSTKALRTGKMDEVIFAGTATRPATSKAEVTLVIDNSERRIDLDLDEVAVTRRLYRDGSSEYELNGISCRLLDIQDLLSDSGVGRHQHVIISQGEIGRILSASPEEHRAVIEESAGILKHRRRQEKAERRLERTDEDVIRLKDLLGEIERQMRPLRRQAKAAREYGVLKDEVTALTLYLGGASLKRLDEQLGSALSQQGDLRRVVEESQGEIEAAAARIDDLEGKAGAVAADLDRASSSAALLETTAERLRRIASVSHERARSLSGRQEATGERRRDLEEERSGLVLELERADEELAEADAAAESAESRFRRLEEEARALETQSSLSPEGAVGAVRGQMAALESALTRDRQELDSVIRRMDALTSQEASERKEIQRLNEEIKALDTETGDLAARYEDLARRRRGDQEAWETAARTLEEARIGLATAASRVDALVETIGGGDTGLRDRLAASPRSIGSLFALLDVPRELERAVEAALGRWAGAVAFEDMGAVRDAVDEVKADEGGGISLVAAMSGVTAPAREVARSLGVDALVDRLGPDATQDLGARLIGDVVLVEGWRAGWDLVARHPALRAVTPDGDLITVSGVGMGAPEIGGAALLEAAQAALAEARTTQARAESVHLAAKRDFDRSREGEREALEQLERSEAGLAGRSEALAMLTRSADGVAGDIERFEQRRSHLEEAVRSAEAQIGELADRIGSLEGEEAARMKLWNDLQQRREATLMTLEEARAAWHEAATRLRAVVERRKLLGERISTVHHELGRLAANSPEESDPSSLRWLGDQARAAVRRVELALAELRDLQRALREEHSASSAELSRARSELDRLRDAISAARERLGELEVSLTEIRLRRESVAETIRRDAGAEPERALQVERPDVPEDADLEELLESKTAALRRLGPINPLAVEEFEALEVRHSFLTEQMEDVESSRRELRKVIAALEEEIIHRFQDAFDEVASAYQRYLAALFPGGRGTVSLIDPDDPHSGVSIEAQPLGKKVSQMSLLSGGERSLVALAFLFAVFEARPSPFYVLDEVEAALDDANLRRFLRIVDEFRGRAQLIVVTHQQQTMEAADVLYGVTMEPGGSSQAVRKDMTVVAADQVA
ncbi:MAG: chromosome segregation protein SMC [Actinobacteria bacterium]|nr:chromosome segregation protein SMC [Actinomycetota bacterium]